MARRLQAPLVLGGAVLAVDALVQLAPYLVEAYDAVPRWVTIGLLGLALLGAGRDLRAAGPGPAAGRAARRPTGLTGRNAPRIDGSASARCATMRL